MTDRFDDDGDETDRRGTDERPDWWNAAIAHHEQYSLLPYEPSRLADGALTHRVVAELEDEYGVDIQFIGLDVTYGDDWEIRVDGSMVETVAHERSRDGYSVYHIGTDDLVEVVRSHVESE